MNAKQRWRGTSLFGVRPAWLSLMSLTLILGCGLSLLPSLAWPKQPRQWDSAEEDSREQDGDWRSHPALAEPDGESHRHGRVLVAGTIKDPRVLAELSRRFRATKKFTFVKKGGEWGLQGGEDFETRQEYFLRLLDYYWFSKDRLTGMSRQKIESIFGPGGLDPHLRSGSLSWSAGRDALIADIKNNRVVAAMYIMGY